MKRFIEGEDRSQVTLLPECLDDYIGEDNPVRVVDAFVEELDLQELGFEGAEPAATGRPSYHPAVLLKIYIYGYLNRIQSSRRLERECQRNVELMWLTGRLAPDFKTIADFRHDNGTGIRNVCRRFVVLCRELKLFSQAIVAIDGSKFKAVNSRDRNFTPGKIDRRQRADRGEHPALPRRAGDGRPHAAGGARGQDRAAAGQDQNAARADAPHCERIKEQLERRARRAALADRSRRALDDHQQAKGTAMVGYNVQAAVDAKHHLIVAHEVTNVGQRPRAAEQDGAWLRARRWARASCRPSPTAATSTARRSRPATTPASQRYVPKPMTSNAKAEGRFDKARLHLHRPGRRVPVPCRPARDLPLHARRERPADPHATGRSACPQCPMKAQCTTERLPTHLGAGSTRRCSRRCSDGWIAARRDDAAQDAPSSTSSERSSTGWVRRTS